MSGGFLGFSRAQSYAFLVMAAVIVIAPMVLYPVFLMKVMCFALFACAFNLLIGYVGLGSFGHAAFFGMGGYITAHSAKVWGLTPELAIILGGVGGAMLGLVFGWLAIRRQGIYFAMITLALAQMAAQLQPLPTPAAGPTSHALRALRDRLRVLHARMVQPSRQQS